MLRLSTLCYPGVGRLRDVIMREELFAERTHKADFDAGQAVVR